MVATFKGKITMTPSMKRRSFMKTAAAASTAVAVPTIIPASALGKDGRPAPSERMTLGCIGNGNNGMNWMRNFLSDDRVQVVAVCDVNKYSKGYWADREGGRDVARAEVNKRYQNQSLTEKDCYPDFRELLARKDIDAVQIATPDHWHALHVIHAARAGKHIYGQKPLSLTIREGRMMSDAVKKAGVTFQTGSQQRSSIHFRKGIELVRNGFIGKVHTIKVGLPGGHPDYNKHGREKEETPVPEGLDYKLWLGPAPEAFYCPARLHVNWRWNLDYSGGQVTDWGAHHIDIAQWAMKNQKTGPVSFTNLKGHFPPRSELYNTADRYDWECTYKDGLKLLVGTGQKGGVTFEGEDGKWIHTNRGRLQSNPEDIVKSKIDDSMERVYVSNDHVRNFVDCVFSGKEPIAPIEDAHRTISIAHLGNIALQLERETLNWNPEKEVVVNDVAANKMLSRPYRAPWKLA
jgi:myo-inositol 2-dehydrogenase/D-chiro-inositol 1-dehydrogenase